MKMLSLGHLTLANNTHPTPFDEAADMMLFLTLTLLQTFFSP